jgi:hypothetical protein
MVIFIGTHPGFFSNQQLGTISERNLMLFILHGRSRQCCISFVIFHTLNGLRIILLDLWHNSQIPAKLPGWCGFVHPSGMVLYFMVANALAGE